MNSSHERLNDRFEQLDKVFQLCQIKNWDSYGALPITKEAYDTTKKLVRLLSWGLHCSARNDGGFEIELHSTTDDGEISVDISPAGEIESFWYGRPPWKNKECITFTRDPEIS